MDPTVDFSGRAVLVTGGTRGIGRGIADRFSEAGASVVVCGRKEVDTPHVFVAGDVRDPDDVERVVTVAVDRFGRLDVVVNNAGGSPPAEAATASTRFTTAIVALNLLAPFFVAQRAYGVMRDQAEGGSIINIASLSGMRPSPGSAAYGAAKAGLINLTQSLAQEWAPEVRVNCVSAGLVATDDALEHYGGADGVARVAATVPSGRMGTPRDVADACVYLASPAAAWVTGTNLVVHGGGERPPFLDA